MKAILIPEGGMSREVEIGGTLDELQALVGGDIDVYPVFEDRGWTMYVNDEGVFSSRPNRAVFADARMAEEGYLSQMNWEPVEEGDLHAILFGPIVVLGFDEESGEGLSLTKEQCDEVRGIFDFGPSGPNSGAVAASLIAAGSSVRSGRM